MLYLIHFEKKIEHAQHYVGATKNIANRIKLHRVGRGANILRVANRLGIKWELVRVWKGSFELEIQMKKMKNSPRYCPVCSKFPSNFFSIDEFPIELIKDEEEKNVTHNERRSNTLDELSRGTIPNRKF